MSNEVLEVPSGTTANRQPKSIVAGPKQPPGGKFPSKRKRKKSRPAASPEAKKIGTDEQAIPDDPGRVTVSRGPVAEAKHSKQSVLVQLVEGGHPVITFEGVWNPYDVRITIGALRRGWRLYQLECRRNKER